MTQTAETHADARDRTWRTFVQGLACDVSVAVVLVLAATFTTIEWTPEYWAALGLSLSRTVLQSGVAYLMRMWVAPRRSS
ncbi:MAG TPA: hypothetical protein VNO31_23945 [Umezawaea sp.]|jgi:hypothetical protein|nr:hypothetical protein [Umezawaea sp.]